jgi:hypothetical protein
MSQHPRSQGERGRNRDNDRSQNDPRKHNISHPRRSSGEEDMERGERRNTRSTIFSSIDSSIDYDRNAE